MTKDKQAAVASAFVIIIAWVFLYNLLILKMSPLAGFFGMIYTINAMLFDAGALLLLGVFMVSLFIFVDVCVQVLADPYSFSKIEALYKGVFKRGRYAAFFSSLLTLRKGKAGKWLPESPAGIAASLCILYFMSFLLILILSEALFFITKGSGFNISANSLTEVLIPAIAIAAPVSARLLALLKYPKAETYADVLPSSFFTVLLISLVAISSSQNPYSFILDALESGQGAAFLVNIAYLSFIPVFIEGMAWYIGNCQD